MASGLMMAALRRTLTYLRPQEIDDLGLIQSLMALVTQHNESAGGRTSYSIETDGEVELASGRDQRTRVQDRPGSADQRGQARQRTQCRGAVEPACRYRPGADQAFGRR